MSLKIKQYPSHPLQLFHQFSLEASSLPSIAHDYGALNRPSCQSCRPGRYRSRMIDKHASSFAIVLKAILPHCCMAAARSEHKRARERQKTPRVLREAQVRALLSMVGLAGSLETSLEYPAHGIWLQRTSCVAVLFLSSLRTSRSSRLSHCRSFHGPRREMYKSILCVIQISIGDDHVILLYLDYKTLTKWMKLYLP